MDHRLDGVVARWRGRRSADAVAYVASALGDHGLIWLLIGLARGRSPGRRRTVAVRAIVFTGVVTPVVNAAVKSAVGRVRPDRRDDDPRSVRLPRSTSFPSGHALAAWCAATLLAEGDPYAPAYCVVAAAVSLSRIHLRLHHASDVLAGTVLGISLGMLGRRCLPPGRQARRRGMGGRHRVLTRP
jgi:undecaprenyl-diphosphatase